MRKRSSKNPKQRRPPTDENEAAMQAVEALTGEPEIKPDDLDELRRQAAKLLGSLGGKKGGPARAKALSKRRRAEIAKKAARIRWQAKGR